MTGIQLTESLSITLMSRFLNHLELLDTINNENIESPDEIVIKYDKAMQEEHGDAVLRNLLKVGKFLGEREEIKWVGSEKRKKAIEDVDEDAKNEDSKNKDAKNNDTVTSDTVTSTATSTATSDSAPLAFVVMMDKICKIGRKCNRVISIVTCLKFYAAILVSCPSLTENTDKKDFEAAFLSILKLIDHVQTFTISRDQVKSKEWRSCLELAGVLLDRIKSVLGEDRHAELNLRLVKSMSAAKIKRREEKRQLVLAEPEKAAKLKQRENQKKYRARKNKTSTGGKSKRKY